MGAEVEEPGIMNFDLLPQSFIVIYLLFLTFNIF